MIKRKMFKKVTLKFLVLANLTLISGSTLTTASTVAGALTVGAGIGAATSLS